MPAKSTPGQQPARRRSFSRTADGWVRARQAVQIAVLLLFIVLFIASHQGAWAGSLVNLPMRLDPLQMLATSLAGRTLARGALLALLTVLFTLVFGRAWCGWLCPLGTVLDWFPFRGQRTRRPEPPASWRRIKYALLFITLAAALLGNLTLLVLDPLAIFWRTLSTVIWPALDQVVTGAQALLYQVPFLGEPLVTLDMWLRPLIFPAAPLYYRDILFFSIFFILLVSANLLAPRFWCRYICPLGALLGLFSRLAIFRRELKGECKGCTLCTASCPTGTIDPAKNYASDPAECTMCLECLPACQRAQITFTPGFSLTPGQDYDPGRREALIAIGAAAAGVALFRSSLLAKREAPFLLRPPGAREANPDVVSLTRCTRCSECIRACPTGALQPALFDAGAEGFATPILVPRLGYCDYSCSACGQVCPTQAIPLLSLAEKRLQVIGKAYIYEDRCLAWSDHTPCVVCEEMCPLPEKAILLEETTVWSPDGAAVQIQLPHVVRERCIGCGICEYKCPVSGESAIRVYIPELEVPF